MKNVYMILLATAVLATGCASTSGRKVASVEAESGGSSVKFAKKLDGHQITFEAERKDGRSSVLKYLRVEFRNCVAEANDVERQDGSVGHAADRFVRCDLDFNVGPFKGVVNARVAGTKHEFVVNFTDEKPGSYDVDIEATVYWDSASGKWAGKGEVNGWYARESGSESIMVKVRETIRF